jgi:7-keto-8-aminopelargonate synthetase-like enzyme
MGTFSKSLASLGGFCACSERVANFMRHHSRPFIFSASITPASVACARKSLEILKREPERVKRLNEIGEYVRKGLTKRKVKFIPSETPIVAVWTYTDENSFLACKKLLEKGVYVNPVISPAVPLGQSILRTSYTATHTNAQLDEAMDKIKEVIDELVNNKK